MVEAGVTGLVVEPGDTGGLARALERLAGDPGLARRMGEAGRRRVEERFSLRANVAELHDLFERTLGAVGGEHAPSAPSAAAPGAGAPSPTGLAPAGDRGPEPAARSVT